MNSALTSRLPFEMFHCVRDVNLGSINSSFFERLIHDFSGRSNKGLTGDIFIIPWLFADEHHRCAFRALAKNGLRRALEKVTGLTIFRRLTRSEEHTSELQSRGHLVCRLLLEKK